MSTTPAPPPDDARMTFHVPPDALLEAAVAESGVGLAIGEDPRAVVHLLLHLRRNHGHTPEDYYDAKLVTDPQTAEELGRALIGAAKAARGDLRHYLATGDPTGRKG